MTKTATLDIGAYFGGMDHLGVAKQLLAEAGVQGTSSNPGPAAAAVRFEEGVTSVAKLRKVIEACGQHCRGEATPRPVCAPEAMPRNKAPGSQVIGATINKSGTFQYRATKVGADTALAQVVKLVQEAQNSKAPALTQADVGFAVGAGTDVAKESADVVLMKSDPHDVVGAIVLSRATLRKMHQNLFWAVAYNVVAFPVAAGLFYPNVVSPEVAALAMSGGSALVAVNALLLKRTRLEGIAKATIRTQPIPALA